MCAAVVTCGGVFASGALHSRMRSYDSIVHEVAVELAVCARMCARVFVCAHLGVECMITVLLNWWILRMLLRRPPVLTCTARLLHVLMIMLFAPVQMVGSGVRCRWTLCGMVL